MDFGLGLDNNFFFILHLKSVELAVERDREHENAEDDAGGVEDAQLRDQPPERDLQTELRLIDNDQRQYISCKYNCSASYVFFLFSCIPMIPTHPMVGKNNPSNSHLHERTSSNSV